MRRSVCALTLAVALVSSVGPARAGTDLGLLAGVAAGTHTSVDNPGSLTGVVPGALLEVTQRWDRFRIHLEGLPAISIRATNAGPLGTSSGKLSLLNSTALYDLDPHHRFRAGFGFQLVNEQSYNGNNGDLDQSRVTSPIYAAGATLPLPNDHFVDLNLMVDPNLRGNLHLFTAAGVAVPDDPEAGGEVDYAAAYGWRRGAFSYLVGARGLTYHTRNTNTGQLLDRNVGAAATFEMRYTLK